MAVTINDIKKLSPKAKAAIIILAMLIIGYFDWFYFLSASMEKKDKLENKLEELQSQVKEKERNAMQFNKYKAEVATLNNTYQIALQKLPDQREIPGLFHSVAMAGKDAGVEFLLFEPKAAVPKMADKQESKAAALVKPSDQRQTDQKPADSSKPADSKKSSPPAQESFYAEIPVSVTVLGPFQNIVYFFEKVAKLPRIVNISDISMGERKELKGRGYVINASCTIKTYMFVDKKQGTDDKTK